MSATAELRASTLFSMKDHVCVVTGGGSGIGLMCAQALSANGAKVYIIGRNQEKLKTAARAHSPEQGAIIPCSPTDVNKKEDIERVVKELSEKESFINLLVTAAGASGPKTDPAEEHAETLKSKLWENETVQGWSDTWTADVTSVYFTSVAFLPLLQKGKDQKGEFSAGIVTISSMSGMMRHAQSHFAYNAAKGGTIHLTKLMSAEFLRLGIRVNSIAPGYFPSEMTAKGSDEAQKSELDPSYVQSKGHVPLNRPGHDHEMAQAVLFLAKCQYVTGEVLAVDGGVLNVVGGR